MRGVTDVRRGETLLVRLQRRWLVAPPPPMALSHVNRRRASGGSILADWGEHLVWFPTSSTETTDLQARFVMVGQSDQGVSAETIVVDNATSGLDIIAGTTIGASL